MALGLARCGVKLAVAAASPDCDDLRQGVVEAGGELEYIQTDLCDREQRQVLIPKVVKRYGQLDALVNCAGVQHR